MYFDPQKWQKIAGCSSENLQILEAFPIFLEGGEIFHKMGGGFFKIIVFKKYEHTIVIFKSLQKHGIFNVNFRLLSWLLSSFLVKFRIFLRILVRSSVFDVDLRF